MKLRNSNSRNTRKLIVREINKKMDEKNDKMIETLIMELDMLRKQVENLQQEREKF